MGRPSRKQIDRALHDWMHESTLTKEQAYAIYYSIANKRKDRGFCDIVASGKENTGDVNLYPFKRRKTDFQSVDMSKPLIASRTAVTDSDDNNQPSFKLNILTPDTKDSVVSLYRIRINQPRWNRRRTNSTDAEVVDFYYTDRANATFAALKTAYNTQTGNISAVIFKDRYKRLLNDDDSVCTHKQVTAYIKPIRPKSMKRHK